jgi:hypothetical protein
MENAMTSPRATRSKTIVGVIVLLIFGAGLAHGLFEDRTLILIDRLPALWIAGAAGIVALAMIGGVIWMQQLDELAQHAHYVAWYWGGSLALAVLVFLVFAAPGLAQLIDIDALLTPLEAVYGRWAGFMSGIMVSLMALTLGYVAWWGLYWLRKQ